MIVVADLHMGNRGSGKPLTIDGYSDVTRTADIVSRLHEAVDYAARSKQSLVFAGDMFHVPNPISFHVGKLLEAIRYARSKGVEVYLIPGNHDSTQTVTNAMIFYQENVPGVHAVESPGVHKVDGIRVAFLPHIPRSEYLNIVRDQPFHEYFLDRCGEYDVLVGHAMIHGSFYENEVFFESADAMPFDPALYQPESLNVLGHVHGHQKFRSRENQSVTVYPGSVTTNNFGELDESKGFIEVTQKLDFGFREWETPETDYEFIEIDLYTKDDFSDDAIREIAEGAAVKVRVKAKEYSQIDERRIRRVVNEVGHLSRFESEVIREARVEGQSGGAFEGIDFNYNHLKLTDEWLKVKAVNEDLRSCCIQVAKEVLLEAQ